MKSEQKLDFSEIFLIADSTTKQQNAFKRSKKMGLLTTGTKTFKNIYLKQINFNESNKPTKKTFKIIKKKTFQKSILLKSPKTTEFYYNPVIFFEASLAVFSTFQINKMGLRLRLSEKLYTRFLRKFSFCFQTESIYTHTDVCKKNYIIRPGNIVFWTSLFSTKSVYVQTRFITKT